MDTGYDKILDASLGLFCEKGFAATSVRDIAALAGVSPANIYSHFANKEEIFALLFERHLFQSQVAKWLGRLVAAWNSPTAVDDLVAIICELLDEHPYYLQLSFIDLTEFKGKYRQSLQRGGVDHIVPGDQGVDWNSVLPPGMSFQECYRVVMFLFNSIGFYTLLSGMSVAEFKQSGIITDLIRLLRYQSEARPTEGRA